MDLLNYPRPFFVLCFAVLSLSASVGAYLHKRRVKLEEPVREDLGLILGSSLTLLGLVIGFSFSMAIGHYDQRKTYEQSEANAIGTEYIRAGLLPMEDAAHTRLLLKTYLDQRILFYTVQNGPQLDQINRTTAQMQNDLWSTVAGPCRAEGNAVAALVLSGMNDVLNSQGYTQAAWWNRIPTGAWALLIVIGIFCNVLFGYHARYAERRHVWFFLLPLLVSISFFLIADLDSPRSGVIHVRPQNLNSLSRSLPRR
jgi:hypothetical protein